MTDLLTRDPNDTGEIPTVDPGETTGNISEYLATAPFPTLRRGELLDAVPYEPHTIGVLDDFQPSAPGPDPTPPFPPPPPPPTPAAGGEHVWRSSWRPETPPRGWLGRLMYRGEHRRTRGAR